MKHYKSVLAAGLSAVLLFAAAGTASATVAKVTKELEYRNIKVTLDGEELDLRNAAGETVEPFMFEGTNYLPVRALAEALGLNVSWDGANATVVLKTGETEEVEWKPDAGTLGESEVAIRGAKMAWDNEGQPAIVVTYGWTNHSERRTMSLTSVSEQAYQDGTELSYAHIDDESIYDPGTSLKEVRPGTTVEVQAAYVLENPAQVVEFELSEFSAYDDPDRVVFRDFNPAELEWANTMPNSAGAVRGTI